MDEISPEMSHEMFALFQHYYDEVSESSFKKDLFEKDYVIILHDPELRGAHSFGAVQGFSTLSIMKFRFNGVDGRAIYSGDTIIDQKYWGQQALPREWCRLAGVLKSEHPEVPLYWLLIVKGHRTYRLMTLFTKYCYPRWDLETPKEISDLMQHLGKLKFGDYFNVSSGLVEFDQSRGQLKPHVGQIEQKYSGKQDVEYFLQKNPNYLKGVELLCLAELAASNMRSVALNAFSEVINQ
jgi:hypothetical protein